MGAKLDHVVETTKRKTEVKIASEVAKVTGIFEGCIV
jgi:hypothetical protein